MAQLTRTEILDAAVELVDEGPNALTIRALGDRLGVTGAALYYWFPAKQDLLDAVAGHLAERIIAVPLTEADWEERLRGIADGVIHAAQVHPGAFGWVFMTYAKRPPLVRIDEELLDVLVGAGFEHRDAMLAKGAFWRLVVGHLGLAALPAHIDPSTVERDDYPHIHAVADVSAALVPADYFARGLDLLIDGIRAAKRPVAR